MTTSDTVYDVVGFFGSLVTALAILPLIIRVVKRRSSVDISYAYQIVFAIGIVMFLVYYAYWDLWAAFFPTFLSLVFMLSLLGMKAYLEGVPCRRQTVADENEDFTGLGVDTAHDIDVRAERRGRSRNSSDASWKEIQPAMSSW